MLGNLAWAPVPAIENVEVLDRFNGVPTFGLFTAAAEQQLFWRVLGYVPRSTSIWLYVPLNAAEESALSSSDSSDLLTGTVFQSPTARYATVGVARDYRLVFEREWQLPVGADPDRLIHEVLGFLGEALEMALAQDMPKARREIVYRTSQAVRELAAA
jgi:hypothetical protein